MALNLDTVRTILETRLVHMGQPKQTLTAEARGAQQGAPLGAAEQLHFAVDVVGEPAVLDVCVLADSDGARLAEEQGKLLRQMQAERQAGRMIDWLSQSVPNAIVFAALSSSGAGGEAQAQKLRRFLMDLFNDETQIRLARAA